MPSFQFKQFNIIQEQSAMKVGTDGVLLGSWVSCKDANTILDVGCGTGLIALMLAQRNVHSMLVGIDIDVLSATEAQLNVNNSNWSSRINIQNTSFQNFIFDKKFDLIVSNPPFFPPNNSFTARDIARRANLLSFDELISKSSYLLSSNGILSVIIPKNLESFFCKKALDYNLYCNRACYVRGNKLSNVKRVMMEFSFSNFKDKNQFLIIEKFRNNYSTEYINLCKDFYFNM